LARYTCKKYKVVTMKKANEYCLLQRCPELMVQKSILVRVRLKKILIPVIPADMADIVKECL
jgi:hypothetical protein